MTCRGDDGKRAHHAWMAPRIKGLIHDRRQGGGNVAKPEWGTKRTCQSCGARFYDMRRQPPTCPKCEAVQEDEAPARARKAKPAAAEKKPKAAPVVKAPETPDEDPALEGETLDDPAVDSDDTSDDDEMIEDASYLGEDDEDMAEVIEHIDSSDKED